MNVGSQRQSKVVFAAECEELFGAVSRPDAWPSFQYQSSEIGKELQGIKEYSLLVVLREANRGAAFTTQSVTNQGLVRPYVAADHPPWLFELFVNENRSL